LAQTAQVAQAIVSFFPDVEVRIVPIKTSGDDLKLKPRERFGLKGIFVKEIEMALLNHEVDLAVHSAKDLPGILPEGLTLGAVPRRELPFDCLITTDLAFDLHSLNPGSRVGTSSLRRRAQLMAFRKDLVVLEIRGNLDTRMKKILLGECEGVILAASGLIRLKGQGYPLLTLSPEIILPAPGQGILALEYREEDTHIPAYLAPLNHEPTALALAAERSFLMSLGVGCFVPAAAWARVDEQNLTLTALVAELDGSLVLKEKKRLESPTIQSSQDLGKEMAEILLARGGEEILKRVSQQTE
jgi:hydroxymethylbilane synthase